MTAKQRLNILVVDRDEGSNIEVKDFLTDEGFQVEVLAEPRQVVEQVRNSRYQIVILDVSPDSHGLDLLEQIATAASVDLLTKGFDEASNRNRSSGGTLEVGAA